MRAKPKRQGARSKRTGQVGLSRQNAALKRELSQARQLETATAAVLKVINGVAFDLNAVLDTLVQTVARLSKSDMAGIVRPRGDTFEYAASYGYSPEFVRFMEAHPLRIDRGTVVGRTLLEGKPVDIPDVDADPEYKFRDAQKVGRFRSMLGVPLLREGAAIGVIVLMRTHLRPFTPKILEMARTFADQAVIAIENTRLFEAEAQRTRELGKLLDDLRAAQDRLVQTEKLASLGQLTAGIAHEIKNPLNFINNFSGVSSELIGELQDVLRDVPLDAKAASEAVEIIDTLRGNLERVVQHGKRADSIIKNMLMHSRAGSGEHRPVDINAIVEESLNLAYHGARAERQGFSIKLEKSLDPAAGQADVYPQEITRVFLNLIANGFYAAVKRQAETGSNGFEPTLRAATRNLGDRVEVSFRDNGTGIPSEVKEKIFNPFFTTKPAGEGTGLGLSISHDIVVKQHAGTIEVESQPGEFTEIRIILPRAAVAAR